MSDESYQGEAAPADLPPEQRSEQAVPAEEPEKAEPIEPNEQTENPDGSTTVSGSQTVPAAEPNAPVDPAALREQANALPPGVEPQPGAPRARNKRVQAVRNASDAAQYVREASDAQKAANDVARAKKTGVVTDGGSLSLPRSPVEPPGVTFDTSGRVSPSNRVLAARPALAAVPIAPPIDDTDDDDDADERAPVPTALANPFAHRPLASEGHRVAFPQRPVHSAEVEAMHNRVKDAHDERRFVFEAMQDHHARVFP